MAKSKKTKPDSGGPITITMDREQHGLLEDRLHELKKSGGVRIYAKAAIEAAVTVWQLIPGRTFDEVTSSGLRALRLLAWYEKLELKRQTEIRAEMDEMGLKEYDLGKAKEA